jgi:Flp pilus assembly protein TadD
VNDPWWLNNIAWLLVDHADYPRRWVDVAVTLAKRASERSPKSASIANTLGTAYYRAGDWNAAIKTLQNAEGLAGNELFSFNAFFIAMSYWHLGDKDGARRWYDRAVEWMDQRQPKNEELRRFRAEAAALLGVKDKTE